MSAVIECFLVALRLGLTSFGGPVAHVSYFREEYVGRLEWIPESRFAEIMSLTQFIPGPGSSQLGAAIGYERAGLLGGFATWIGFTLPSALVRRLPESWTPNRQLRGSQIMQTGRCSGGCDS